LPTAGSRRGTRTAGVGGRVRAASAKSAGVGPARIVSSAGTRTGRPRQGSTTSPHTSSLPHRADSPSPDLLERLTTTQWTVRDIRHLDNTPYADVCTSDCNLAMVVAAPRDAPAHAPSARHPNVRVRAYLPCRRGHSVPPPAPNPPRPLHTAAVTSRLGPPPTCPLGIVATHANADVGCIGPAQALPSIVQASPKLLRPLAAAERHRHRRSVNGHGFSVTVDSGGARA
jgi:hypothetical protein